MAFLVNWFHTEGAYLHNLLDLNFDKNGYADMWRLRENASRNGNLYPTHGLGPIAQCLDINRGDKMEYLVSMSSNDFLMGQTAKEKAAKDSFYQEFASKKYRGNMNTTVIRTNKGKTIMLQHDVTSPRPYSRIHQLTGTKGMACKWPEPARISLGDTEKWISEAEMKDLENQYTLPLVKQWQEHLQNRLVVMVEWILLWTGGLWTASVMDCLLITKYTMQRYGAR